SIKVKKLLEKGCMGYLPNIMDTREKLEVKPKKVLVISEFLDVFPEDLSRLPPNREIEFVIDLLPGTAPISKAPYRMAPVELKELKVQLQGLLDKGFIRPSFSP
ncbi:hypothetical protein PanWU01x14_082900, partial [Parasponia andersonii]